ncbi:aminotransferase-like protein [Scheffersomyces amazonensis]|uniref:aminotransferase-like protein n=1 Tax=Scheffersomyces amazonensis TaxID=1078765 RepID=UPI00315D349E
MAKNYKFIIEGTSSRAPGKSPKKPKPIPLDKHGNPKKPPKKYDRHAPKPPPSAEVLETAAMLDRLYMKPTFPEKLPPDFEILSTIRYDPKLTALPPETFEQIVPDNFFLIRAHIRRLIFTFQYFQRYSGLEIIEFDVSPEFLSEQLVEAIKRDGKPVYLPLKLRLLMTLDGTVKVEVHETPVRENLLYGLISPESQLIETNSIDTAFDLPTLDEGVVWDVYIDKQFTPMSPFTSFKTTHRNAYNDARARTLPGKSSHEEVLMHNPEKCVMEGSITNIAVRDEKHNIWVTPRLSSGCLCGTMRSLLLRKHFLYERVIKINEVKVGDDILLFNAIMGIVRGKIVG